MPITPEIQDAYKFGKSIQYRLKDDGEWVDVKPYTLLSFYDINNAAFRVKPVANMPFMAALEHFKNGKEIKRSIWTIYSIWQRKGVLTEAVYLEGGVRAAGGGTPPTLTVEDYEATDWQVVD